jgi:hypothetical protein
MWHGLGVQCDMDGRRVIVVLQTTPDVSFCFDFQSKAGQRT